MEYKKLNKLVAIKKKERNRLTHTENKPVITSGKGQYSCWEVGGTNY